MRATKNFLSEHSGTVLAASAIESSNVVGYMSADTQKNGITAGGCFVPVSENTKIDLLDLKVTGYDESTEADVTVQTLDEYGRTSAIYYYYDVPGEITGWLDGNDNEVERGTATIQPGEGLWVFASGDGFGLQSSGQVPTSGISVTLQKNGLSVANPTPVNVDLTECSVGGYEESTEADVTVQTLDEYGRTSSIYYYYDVPGEITGWLDGNDNEVEEGAVTMKPGQGLWTMSSDDGFTFVFPGVTL